MNLKLLKHFLLGATIAFSGIVINAQELSVPADPAPNQLDFVQRTLVIQYTGIDCPNCPAMIRAIEGLVEDETYSNKYCLLVNHGYKPTNPLYPTGPNDGGDNLYVLYLPDSYPRALVGYTEKIDYCSTSALKTAIDNCLTREVKAGIAVNSKLEKNTLTIKAQLKAAKTDEYVLSYCLLENGIEKVQAGGMGLITHNNVVRYTEYPTNTNLGTVNAGATADVTFSIPIKSDWKIENCHLVLWACSSINGDYKYGMVTNAIKAPLNTAIPYEYQSVSAIDKVEVNDIQVDYSSDQLDVTATSPIETLAIYNLQGKLMLQRTPATHSVSLSLNDLPAGAYIVRIGNAQTVKTQKIIKQ